MSWFKRDDVVLELLKDQNTRLTAETAWLRERLREMTDQVFEMKREGFQYQPQAVRREEFLPQFDDRVLAAIRSRAGEGTALAHELGDFAKSLEITGVETEDIVDRILSGGTDE